MIDAGHHSALPWLLAVAENEARTKRRRSMRHQGLFRRLGQRRWSATTPTPSRPPSTTAQPVEPSLANRASSLRTVSM
jgi:hypothetical protein